MQLTALLLALLPQDPAGAAQPSEVLEPLTDFSVLSQPAPAGAALRVFQGRTTAPGAELLRLDGPAVVRRIWLPRAEGTLAFHFGGANEPALVLDPAAAGAPFAGQLVRRPGGAFDSLLPVPVPAGGRVTASAAGLDYRIEVELRSSADGLELPDGGYWQRQGEAYGLASDMIERGEFLLQPRQRTTTMGRIRTNSRISSTIRRAGTVHGVRLQVTNAADLDLEQLFRGLRLRISADKATQVDVPLGDFFGASSALPAGSSHLLRATYDPKDGLILESFLPMPFSDGIKLVVLNESFEVPLCRLYLYWSEAEPGPWRLHAAWNRVAGAQGDFRCRLLEADGPGRLLGAGVALKGEGYTGAVDPSGYFGLAAGPLTPGRTAFQGVGQGNGWTSFDRLMPGGGYVFEDSLVFELPLQLGEQPVDLATIAWWYGPAEAGHGFGELPDTVDRALR